MGLFDKLKKAGTFALDLTSAIAKNPLAILSPTKETEKIKQLRTSGTKEERISYIKTTALQTAVNVGGTLAGAGLIGSAAKNVATNIGTKVIQLGVVASPLIVGSSTIREKVAGTSPIELGVKTGEKIEKAIEEENKEAGKVAEVIGTIGAGAIGAGLVMAGKEAYDYLKKDKIDTAPFSPAGATPVGSLTPLTPQTTSVNVAKEVKGGSARRKRKKRSSKPSQMPTINIKIDDRDIYNGGRKIYKGGRF